MGVGRLYRLRVALHVFMCRECRRYKKQIRALGDAARGLLKTRSDGGETLERLHAEILEGINPSANDDAEK